MTMRIPAAAVAVAALAFGAPALAAGQAGSDSTTVSTSTNSDDGHAQRFVVLSQHLGQDGHAAHDGTYRVQGNDGTVYQIDGGNGVAVVHAKDGKTYRVLAMGDRAVACGPAHALVDQQGGDAHDKTRVILCGNEAANPAERADRLEHMMDRIQHMDGLSDSSKERLTTALREAITELRAAH